MIGYFQAKYWFKNKAYSDRYKCQVPFNIGKLLMIDQYKRLCWNYFISFILLALITSF
mgnify:FL=1